MGGIYYCTDQRGMVIAFSFGLSICFVKLHVHYVRDKINPEGPVDFFSMIACCQPFAEIIQGLIRQLSLSYIYKWKPRCWICTLVLTSLELY